MTKAKLRVYPATIGAVLLWGAVLFPPGAILGLEPCRIEVVERGSGWPVPLVELRTTHHVSFVSDNAGVIAFDVPELMGVETWFYVTSHGYEVPKDGFGYRGVRLKPEPGKTLKVEITRTILARRLGRLTGAGLFAESQKTGRELDWKESGVLGCDSVLNAVFRGRLFWLWGDTTLAKYPLGIFDSSSANTAPQPITSFQPPVRLAFEYFRGTNGAVRGVAPMPGSGPTWLAAYVTLSDRQGVPHLVATYSKIKGSMQSYEKGLCVWNEKTAAFDRLKVVWSRSDQSPAPPPMPEGHPVSWKDREGKEWVLFGNPFPRLRCPASFEAWQDPATWEVLHPQAAVADAQSSAQVKPHTGTIAFNAWRQRWVTIFMEAFGKPSVFGEVWYAEATDPQGPWGPAVKVLSHNNYTFYNPKLHPDWTNADSPILLFEGTYTQEFADHPPATPRYDYNQILYRLDLDDPALQQALRGKR